MISRLSCAPAAVLVVLCMSSALFAEDAAWQKLGRLKSGNDIQVVDFSLKKVSGKFVGFTDQDITLKSANGEITIAREQVYRVTRPERKRNVLIGLAVGAAAGTIYYAADPELGAGTCSENCIDPSGYWDSASLEVQPEVSSASRCLGMPQKSTDPTKFRTKRGKPSSRIQGRIPRSS